MTHQSLTTEELDALVLKQLAARDSGDKIEWRSPEWRQTENKMAVYISAILDAAPRLIEQARRGAESELVKDRAIAISSGAVAVLHEKLAVAESALSTTRERLEIAVEALKTARWKCNQEYCEHKRTICVQNIADAALDKISAIAAKAGTGGKGEGT